MLSLEESFKTYLKLSLLLIKRKIIIPATGFGKKDTMS
jgi:hypothetical protein